MLTQEQINNLKPGDPVFVRGKFKSVDDDGDFWIETGNCHRCYDPLYVSLPSEHGTFLSRRSSEGAETEVPTKYDPTRLFKKGDKVKRRTVDGRTDTDVVDNVVLTVTKDEDSHGNVRVKEPYGRSIVTKSVFLKLVTPIEEHKPYSVHEESSHNRWNVIKDKYVHGIHAMFPYKNIGNSDLMSREEAKARADEYSDLLNAEWRKEQTHG